MVRNSGNPHPLRKGEGRVRVFKYGSFLKTSFSNLNTKRGCQKNWISLSNYFDYKSVTIQLFQP
jgi:hypothetical protein